MNLGLDGCKVVVLGGAKGIGRGISEALAAEGGELLIASRDEANLATVAEQIRTRQGAKVSTAILDLANESSIDAFLTLNLEVDILVLNGGGPPPGPVADVKVEAWRSQFEAMVLAPIRIATAMLPWMRKQRFGRIIVVLSSGVVQPIPNLGVSNTMRSALVAWAKTLAAEVAGDGVTVNGVVPGRIGTDRVAALDRANAQRKQISPEQERAASLATIPAGRYGTVDELGSTVAFLASRKASYITGSLVRVDGGLIRSI